MYKYVYTYICTIIILYSTCVLHTSSFTFYLISYIPYNRSFYIITHIINISQSSHHLTSSYDTLCSTQMCVHPNMCTPECTPAVYIILLCITYYTITLHRRAYHSSPPHPSHRPHIIYSYTLISHIYTPLSPSFR